jgi:3-oxoacyl-[acyl-carrier-protein] synthase-1
MTLHWLKDLKDAFAPNAQAPRFDALRVVGRGMCCSLGHSASATSAALNARITHFQQSRFVGQGGRRINAAMLHGVDVWGMDRLAMMLQAVISEALAAEVGAVDHRETALLVCFAEHERSGMDSLTFRQGIELTVAPWGFHPKSLAIDCGKGGIAAGLMRASVMLKSQNLHHTEPRRVLLVGLDSLLLAGTIEQLIGMDRLLTTSNSDGLIPGEGAAALWLESTHDASPRQAAGLHIVSVHSATEEWRLDGEVPARALGLTQAVRGALQAVGATMSELDFQVSGFNGEGWYAKEISLMQSRCMTTKRSRFPHLTPCQALGETGAAGPVLALAWLADLMGRGEFGSPGRSALAHFSGDDGRRSAMVLRYLGGTDGLSLHAAKTH